MRGNIEKRWESGKRNDWGFGEYKNGNRKEENEKRKKKLCNERDLK